MLRSGRPSLLRALPASGLLLAVIASPGTFVSAQNALQDPLPTIQEADEDSDSGTEDAPEGDDDPDQPQDALTAEQRAEVADAIESLGSNEFAVREQAATDLLQFGLPILSDLRRAAEQTDDPEVRIRAQELIKQLTFGDMEARIEDFLSGAEVKFEGWRVARGLMGDSSGVRELFVELMKEHPDVLSALEGTPRDRAMAMDAAVNRIQAAMFIQRRFPTRADAFALLLPAIFPDVELNTPFENLLISVLQKEAASKLRRDAQLSRPFDGLLGRWIRRSTLANRDDVLLLGMSWGVDDTLMLAVQTLDETNQTETLAFALQAIARFGNRDHVELVRPLLDDKRLATERGYTAAELVRTRVSDAAMATIALLNNVPLSQIGFQNATEHPTFGFVLGEIGFPVADEAPRKAARAKLDKLLEETAEAAEGS